MLGEILVGALVIVVAVLVAVDFFRTKSEGPHGHAEGSVAEGRPRNTVEGRGGTPEAFFRESAGSGMAAAVRESDPGRRPESNPPAAGRQRPGVGPADSRSRKLKDWPVRSRLLLLVVVPAVAVAVAAFCVVRLVDVLRGTQIHSSTSSVHDRAIVTALVVAVVMIVVLVLASCLTVVAARSILVPLYKLQAGALEVANVRLPDEIRRINENNSEGVPSGLKPIDVNSADELGDVAHAVNEMGTEVLRLTANESGLQGKLDAMFVNLSHRSQSLVERQIRFIESLEQEEQDRERLARLSRMNRIAGRMHRSSQNLLILAGHVPSSSWSQQPIALVNVIRAAVSEIEEYERISLSALPDVAVAGPAVNDVVHLLAELAENATSFSAGDMRVDISGHLVMSGGVLVDITDRGVGMGEKELAYANWRLENPPAADINVPKSMGLFVVARLAGRHGIRIRLRQAEFGGLTVLVWLPDEVIARQGAASPRRGSHGGAAPNLDEVTVDGDLAFARNPATAARSAEFASSRQDIGDASLGRRFIADTGRRLGPSHSATRPQPVVRAEVPAGVRSPGPERGQDAQIVRQQAPGGTFGTGPSPALSASAGSASPQFASSPLDTSAPLSQATTDLADGGVIVPPVASHPDFRGLPIFDSVESHWFSGGGREAVSSSGRAAAAPRWSSPADEGWHAAEAADAPSSSGSTEAGLPRRAPNTNLIPGAIPNTEPVAPPVRSATAARARLAGLQRGVSEGRAAASEAENPDGEDGS